MIPSFINPDFAEDFLDDYKALCKRHNLTILPNPWSGEDLILSQAELQLDKTGITELQHSIEAIRR